MTVITSILLFLVKLLLLIFILGIIILVHEFGHFIWAKTFKVHIYEFSIGMGPVLRSWKGKKDKITYNIRLIPIGGFVSMAGEVYEDDKRVSKNKMLCNKPWYQRLIILVAGVINNFILAIFLLIIGAYFWKGSAITPKIENVLKNSPSAEAGLVSGDIIKEINGYKVGSWDKAQIILYYKNSNDYTTFKIKHADGNVQEYHIKSETFIDDETGKETQGYGITLSSEDTSGFFKPIIYGFRKFFSLISSMVYTIFGLITGKVSLSALSGPVGIYEVVGSTFSYSIITAIEYVIFIIAFLSINVGFINILPFPAFDGGHVLFLLIEVITRHKVNAKIENICHTVGFALILLLMIIVSINDIIKLF